MTTRTIIGLALWTIGCTPIAQIDDDEALGPLPPGSLPPDRTLSPANVQPVLFGDDIENVSFVRVDGDSESVVSFEKNEPIFDHVAYVLDVDAFEQGAQLTIQARCDDCSEDERAALSGRWPRSNLDDVTPPVFADGEAEVTASAFNDESLSYTHYTITVKLPPLDEPVAMRFVGDEADVVLKPLGSPDFPFSFNVAGAEARTACFRATAIDVAGNETEFPDQLCAELNPDVNSSSCAQSSASTPSLFAVAMIALACARRRMRQRVW